MPKSYLAAVLCLLVAGMAIAAQPSAPKAETDAISTPQLINYQGKLTDSDGDPLTGTYDMAFAIYNVASGGSALWSESQASVVVTDGIFNVILGSVTPVSGLPEGPDCYLGITVETDPEISPRTRLVSVPYATMAQDADDAANLGGIAAADYATQSWVNGLGFATYTWVTTNDVGRLGVALNLYEGATALSSKYSQIGHAHSAADITSGVLPIPRGGTNNNSYVQGGVIYYNGASSALTSTAAGTSGQVLTSNGSAAPTWTTISVSNYWTVGSGYIYPNTPSSNSNARIYGGGSVYNVYGAAGVGSYGIYGSAVSGGWAVYGSNTYSGSDPVNAAVIGHSANGVGVYGHGYNYGLYGYSPAYSLYGAVGLYSPPCGAYGYGANFYGLYGYSTSTSGYAGVYGYGYRGVYGYSTQASGYGVYGVHTYTSSARPYGVCGYGTNSYTFSGYAGYGVYGYSSNYYSGGVGVYGYATYTTTESSTYPNYGVYGYAGGVYGVGTVGYGGPGYSGDGVGSAGVYGRVNAADYTGTYYYSFDYTRAGVKGYNFNGFTGCFGVAGYRYDDTDIRSGGVLGAVSQLAPTAAWGSLGYQNSGSAEYGGYFTSYTSGTGDATEGAGIGLGATGDLMGAWAKGKFYGAHVSGSRYALYTDGNNYTSGVSAMVQDVGGTREAAYVATSENVDIYASGVAELTDGRAVVSFSDRFSKLVSSDVPVVVTVTPMGPEPVYLTESDAGGFAVRAVSGKGSVRFSWIAVGRRAGYEETPELPAELARTDFDQQMAKVCFNENDTKNSAQPMWFDGTQLRFDQRPEEPRPPKPVEARSPEPQNANPVQPAPTSTGQ